MKKQIILQTLRENNELNMLLKAISHTILL